MAGARLILVLALQGPEGRPVDVVMGPPVLDDGPRGREVGTATTLFVNFDGLRIGGCNPSNSHGDCHWYNVNEFFDEFSGDMQSRVSILQTVRRDVADFGIRVTAQRPDDSDDYTMVVYGGEEAEYGSLGSAPSGDCLDQIPNQIAFAYLDGPAATWVNGGASTVLQEAAHTWGLDHVDADGAIMYPLGTNFPTTFSTECAPVVANVDLDLGEGSCPEVNTMFCPSATQQNATETLKYLFGPAYVDSTAPTLELVEPVDGEYFQRPASFDVRVDVEDDLHPQVYEAQLWLDGDTPPDPFLSVLVEYDVNDLPVGEWLFHLRVVDEAGNEAMLSFEVEVGVDPPPDPPAEGCACATNPPPVSGAPWACWLLLCPLAGRRLKR